MRPLLSILLAFFCHLGWSADPIETLRPYTAVRALRSTLFTENQLLGNTARQGCERSLRLTPQLMKDSCGDAADYVAFSLIAQGVSPENVRMSGFDHARRRTSLWDVFVGKRAPGHVFAIWRTTNEFVVLDPTFFQFKRTKLVKALGESALGLEILRDLRKFGFWVATREHWSAFLKAFAQEYEEVRSMGFDQLANDFDKFTMFDFKTGAPIPVERAGFETTLRSFDAKKIRERIGENSKKIRFLQIDATEWIDLDSEISWPLVPVR